MDRVAEFLKVAEVKLDSHQFIYSKRDWQFIIAFFAAFIEIWNWQIGDPRPGKGEDGSVWPVVNQALHLARSCIFSFLVQ